MAPEIGGRKRREAKSRCRILYWHLRITLWDQYCLLLFCMMVGGANFECHVDLTDSNQGTVYQNHQQYRSYHAYTPSEGNIEVCLIGLS